MSLYFLFFELVVLALFILCLRHAWQQGLQAVYQLLAGVTFGLLLERGTILQLHAYHYGQFTIMLGDVPLAIGVAWGVIIYSVNLFAEASTLPIWLRPVLCGLLALNIDLAMDAIAIRLGMWDWGQGLHFEYFGVPWANFWAWFWVVCSFTLGLRLFSWWPGWVGRWLAPLGAILVGLIVVLGTNALLAYVVPRDWYPMVVFLTLGWAVLVVLLARPRLSAGSVSPVAFWVPFGSHFYFLVAGLVSGVILMPSFLLVASLGMFSLAFYLHRHFWYSRTVLLFNRH